MKKISKLSVLSALSFISLSVPTFVISCTSINKRRYVLEFSSPYAPVAFIQDASRSFGKFLDSSVTHQTSVGLLAINSLNEVEVRHDDIKDEKGKIVDVRTYITKPTYAAKKLALASAIIVVDQNDKAHVFDSDDYKIEPDVGGEETTLSTKEKIKTYKSPTIELKSENKRSINSEEFEKQLKTAKKVQFVIRDNVHYVDENGVKTKYRAKAKDFYYSWLRTNSINDYFRKQEGGSESLDKEAQEALSDPSSSAFTDRESYSNEYLFALFGIDSSKFKKEEHFIQNVKAEDSTFNGKEAVTFEKLGSGSSDFSKFIALLYNDYTFMPVPSEYIDDANTWSELPVYNYIGTKTEKTKAFEKKIRALDKNSLMYKIGAYWYGVSLKNTLYIGPYYILPQKGQELRLRKNLHYFDKEWVKADDNIDEIFEIHNSDVETDIFTRRNFNQYKQGRVSQIGFASLKPHQKSEILKNSLGYGLRFSRAINKTSPFYRMVSQPFIRPIPEGNDTSFYGFNDAYAKLVYGGTREELKTGTHDPQEYIAGTGLIFRTLLNAAINWNELASQATSGEGTAWVAKVADGSSIGGSDQSTSKIKTPFDVKDEINSLFALTHDGKSKLKFNGKDSLKPSENDEAVKNISTKTDRLKSAGFQVIKQELEKLFKEFDEKNPSLKGQNFEFSHMFPYTNIPANYKEAFKNITKTFSELHPRIKIKVFETSNKADPKFDAFRNRGANGAELVSWGYDYDAIGSGYDGLSWNTNLIATLTWIAANKDTKKTETLKANFPKIYKLADEIVKYSEEENTKWIGSVPFKDLHLVTNDFKQQRLQHTTKFEFKKENKVYVLVKDAEGKPKEWKPNNGKPTDAYAWSAQFWLNYINKMTNDEAKELMKEFTSFFNVDFTYGMFKQKNEFGRFVVQKHFIVPDGTLTGATMYANWKIDKNK